MSPSLSRVDFFNNDSGEFRFVLSDVLKVKSHENVMPPTSYSELLASELFGLVDENNTVLDLGCGTGFLAIILSKCGAKEVFASDVNESAVELARYNLARNGLGGVTVVHSDLFSGFDEKKFDLITSNPPFLPVTSNRQTQENPNGRDIIDKIISESPKFLNKKGKLVFTQSSLAGAEKTFSQLEENGFRHEVLAKHKLEFRPCTYKHMDFAISACKHNNGEYLEENDKYYEWLYIICASLKE